MRNSVKKPVLQSNAIQYAEIDELRTAISNAQTLGICAISLNDRIAEMNQ